MRRQDSQKHSDFPKVTSCLVMKMGYNWSVQFQSLHLKPDAVFPLSFCDVWLFMFVCLYVYVCMPICLCLVSPWIGTKTLYHTFPEPHLVSDTERNHRTSVQKEPPCASWSSTPYVPSEIRAGWRNDVTCSTPLSKLVVGLGPEPGHWCSAKI